MKIIPISSYLYVKNKTVHYFPVEEKVLRLCEHSPGSMFLVSAFQGEKGRYPNYPETDELITRYNWIKDLADKTKCFPVIEGLTRGIPKITLCHGRGKGLTIREAEPGKYNFGLFLSYLPKRYKLHINMKEMELAFCDRPAEYEEVLDTVNRAVRHLFFLRFSDSCEFAVNYNIFCDTEKSITALTALCEKAENETVSEAIISVIEFLNRYENS